MDDIKARLLAAIRDFDDEDLSESALVDIVLNRLHRQQIKIYDLGKEMVEKEKRYVDEIAHLRRIMNNPTTRVSGEYFFLGMNDNLIHVLISTDRVLLYENTQGVINHVGMQIPYDQYKKMQDARGGAHRYE